MTGRDAAIGALASTDRALRVHLIGVAGSGMSGLAGLLLELGHHVSGCDRATTSETERLQKAGLAFYSPHTREPLKDAEAVVYSSAIKPGNIAYDAAVDLGLPMLRRAEALAALLRTRRGIVVAGTHGKTTTSAMVAHALRGAGLDPSHYVGAETPILGTNAHLGQGDYFVAEGDESDGTLVAFEPEHAIVLNVEAEHLDHYPDGLPAIERVFATLLDQTSGASVYCGDDPGARRVCAGRPGAASYGLGEGNRFRATSLKPFGQSTTFTAWDGGRELGPVVLNIPGEHNVRNALGTLALTSLLGVPFGPVRDALGTFRGARRRFEVRYVSARFRVVDDYGHHPTEIAATLEAARGLSPGRVVCIFQPHRFSRTHLLGPTFGPAFAAADAVFVTDVYAAGEEPIAGVGGTTVVEAVREACPDVLAESAPTLAAAAAAAGNFLRPGDLVLTLGAGDVHRVASRLARQLAAADALHAALGDAAGDATLRLYEPLAKHTTLRVGGPAEFWVEVRSEAAFARAVRFLRAEAVPIRVVGRGSNLLVRDGGVRGAVIHPGKGSFDEVRVEGDLLTAGAGVRLKKLCSAARAAGLGGFEWMEGIPGNVGGALRMNAGAVGAQTFDQIVSVRLLDRSGNTVEKGRDDIVAHYRDVPELAHHFALSATFRGTPGTPASEIDARLEAAKEKRKSSQPIAASAGCIFKNPGPVPAGKLVDELGLKDAAVGAARVSSVHGNFIVNEGDATAHDVLTLIEKIRSHARESRGIQLETEVQIIGEYRDIVEV